MKTVTDKKMVYFPNNHLHKEIKIEMVQEKHYKVLDLYNENSEWFQSCTVWNKHDELTASYEMEMHYNMKYKLMSVLKSIHNKYRVTKRLDNSDIEQVNSMVNDWIVKDSIKEQMKYTVNALNNDDISKAYTYLMNVKSYVDYSVPATDKDGFYLLTIY